MDDRPGGSPSQPGEVELPYQTQADVTPWPLPHWSSFDAKTLLVQQIRYIYLHHDREGNLKQEGKRREFKTWQAALFYMLPAETLDELLQEPKLVLELGDYAKIFGTRIVTGRGGLQSDSTPAEPSTNASDGWMAKVRAATDKFARDVSAAAKQAASSSKPTHSSNPAPEPEGSRVTRQSSVNSLKGSAQALRGTLSTFGKRFRRGSTSSNQGKETLQRTISDKEAESAPMPTTISRAAGKRQRIQSISFGPPALSQEPEEAGFVKVPAPADPKLKVATGQVAKRNATRLPKASLHHRFQV